VIRLWRVAKRRHSPFTGEGGLYVAGRWHERGVRIVYTAGTKALSVLEFLAHLTPGSTPSTATWWWLDLDESQTPVETVDPASLPARWRGVRHLQATRALGTQWIREQRTPVLGVPSVHVSGEFNYLVNPLHVLVAPLLATVGGPEDFSIDRRILAATWTARSPRPRRRKKAQGGK
jgi:RES domain-containing protein